MASRDGVAVVGSISADLTVYASALPRPGETVIGDNFSMVLGGKGANQALAAVRAGAPTFMVGAVGDDQFGELTLATLNADGVDTSAVRVLPGSTGIAHIRVDTASGENDIVIVPEANHRLEPDAVEQSLRALRDRISVVLVQLESPLAVVHRVAEVCRSQGLRLILDPAPAQPLPEDVARGVRGQTQRDRGGDHDRAAGHRRRLRRSRCALVPRPRGGGRRDHPGRSRRDRGVRRRRARAARVLGTRGRHDSRR